MTAHGLPLATRFWQKVDKSGECWLWTGATMADGYGHIKIEGRMVRAHRVSYELHVGPITEGLDLDHLCRVRACVRPDHLEAVPRRVNVLRGEGVAAKRARQDQCKRGHPLDAENTYRWRTSRICRTCSAQRSADAYLRRKAAG